MKVVLSLPKLQEQPFGQQYYLENFLKALLSLIEPKMQVTAFTVGLKNQLVHKRQLERLDPYGRLNVRICPLPHTLLKNTVLRLGVPNANLLFGPTDVVHNLSGCILPPVRNSVFTIQDLFLLREEVSSISHSAREELHREMIQLASAARKIITISDFSKREICSLLELPTEKVCVIPNGVDRQIFHPISEEERVEAVEVLGQFSINAPYIIHLGGYAKRKNVSSLIRAFDMLKSQHQLPHKLVIVGGGVQNDIGVTINTSRFKSDIVLTGYLSQREVVRLLQSSDAMVFPSLYEGFGLPPLEAMACGVPVAMSNAASLPEVGGDAVEYFHPLDCGDIAVSILKVTADESRRRALIQGGLDRAQLFSWQENASSTIAIYNALVNE